MKIKTTQEQNAADRQVELLTNALGTAPTADGYWLNATGRMVPRLYGHSGAISAFNALVLGLHADANGLKVAQYTTFNEAAQRREAIMQGEKGVPFLWYRWESYVNRHNPEDVVSREQYQQMEPDKRALYKGVRQREVRTVFALEQTTMPMVNEERWSELLQRYGSRNERGNLKAEERQMHSTVKQFAEQMKSCLIPIRRDVTGMAHYNPQRDAIYIPEQKHYAHYEEYVQELMRQVVTATGHRQRLAREGMVMNGGVAPSDSAVRYEALVAELASGVKMMELGLPAKIADEHLDMVPEWNKTLREQPHMVDAVETDVNNAIDVIRKAEQGEKVEWTNLREESISESQSGREAEPIVERVQMLKDEQGRYTIYVKMAGEDAFGMVADKEDVNRYFSTIKQKEELSTGAIRTEMAIKYYALAQREPQLKVELTGEKAPQEAVERIERANIYQEHDTRESDGRVIPGRKMIVARISGAEGVKPRPISQLQWQRIWAAEDPNAYKRNLAAVVYADVIAASQRNDVGMHHGTSAVHTAQPSSVGTQHAVSANAEASPSPAVENSPLKDWPNLKQVDELKAKHPDAVMLMRVDDRYESYREDATRVQQICGIDVFERVNPLTDDHVQMTSFPAYELDTLLPKLIRAGQRVAICDKLEAPKQEVSRDTSSPTVEQNNETRRTGMRM